MHRTQISERLNDGNLAFTESLADLESQGFSREQALAILSRLLDQQAFMLSASDIFLVSAALFLAMAPMIWFARPPKTAA